MKKISLWALGVVLIAGSVWGVIKLAESSPTSTIGSGSIPEVTSSDHILGDVNAKVKVVEYADYQCPACAQASPMLNQLAKDYPNQIVLVYRAFPLLEIHQNAAISEAAAEAASKQGKFWEMHDMLFSQQSQWAKNTGAGNIFVAYAQSLGLNVEQFKSDLNSSEISSKVKSDYNEATRLKLDHTPTIYINGKEIDTPGSYDGYKRLVEEALK